MTGAQGQVGRALKGVLPRARFADRSQLDVTDWQSMREAVRGVDVVVHLAALTDVDRCEVQPELAHKVNATGTEHVVEAASERGAKVVYLSTDYVFDGHLPRAYEETDTPHPLNVYGRSKLAGENVVGSNPSNLTVRTSWVIGEGRNFVRKMIALREKDSVRVIEDQRGRPTFASDLAVALNAAIDSDLSGVVHISAAGSPVSWASLAETTFRLMGTETQVTRVTAKEFAAQADKVVAPRPANSVLALGRAQSLKLPLFEWYASLKRYLAEEA